MKLTVCGSSSAGNGYLLTDSKGSSLLLEAGVHPDEVYRAMKYDVSGLVAVCASHSHSDHSAYIKYYAERGRKVLALAETLDAHDCGGNDYCKPIEPMHGYKMGDYKILPFAVRHDVPCIGFVIEHPEMGKLLFATDTMMLEYRFDGLNHIMIEANYSDEIVERNIDNGVVRSVMKDRLMTTHLSLENAIGMLKANDLSNVNEIILIHLSDNNSDAAGFMEAVVRATGKPVYIAKKGLEVEVNREVY